MSPTTVILEPLSCLFPVRSAPLSNGMQVSENHPRKTRGFYTKIGSGASFGRCWAQIVQDAQKSTSNWWPKAPFGSTWTLCGACWAHFQPAFDQILLQLELRNTPQGQFVTVFSEMCDLCISMPLSSGVAIIAGPGIQVGATCNQKSHRIRLAQPNQLSRAVISQAQPNQAQPNRFQLAQPSRPSSAKSGFESPVQIGAENLFIDGLASISIDFQRC